MHGLSTWKCLNSLKVDFMLLMSSICQEAPASGHSFAASYKHNGYVIFDFSEHDF